jgi:hypothetical protein
MPNRIAFVVLTAALCATLALGTDFRAEGKPGGTIVSLAFWVCPVGAHETCTAYITYPADSNHANDTDVVVVNAAGISGSLDAPAYTLDVAVEIVSPRTSEVPGLIPVVVKLTNMGDTVVLVPRLDVKIDPTGYRDYRVDIPVAVGENRVEMEPHAGMSLTLLPSPLAGNVLHVEYSLNQAGPANVTLFDISGRPVAKRDFVADRTGELPLDLHLLSGGVYLVRLEDGHQSLVRKLVVQR